MKKRPVSITEIRAFVRLRPNDTLVEEARGDAQYALLSAGRRNDILQIAGRNAERNAEDSIRAFVTTLGFEKVRFV